MTRDREGDLVRAGLAREMIRSVFVEGSVERLSPQGLYERHKKAFDEIKYDAHSLARLLRQMAESGGLEATRDGRTVRYCVPGLMAPVEEKPVKTSTKAIVKIEIVKKTGKVRLEIGGLTVEIGVVDN